MYRMKSIIAYYIKNNTSAFKIFLAIASKERTKVMYDKIFKIMTLSFFIDLMHSTK